MPAFHCHGRSGSKQVGESVGAIFLLALLHLTDESGLRHHVEACGDSEFGGLFQVQREPGMNVSIHQAGQQSVAVSLDDG